MNAVKSSTATGTTATAEPEVRIARYRGRFAPSPTGLLHHGSLVAALASWLDARVHHGQWLLRMEDLDTARNVRGAADAILRTLDNLGLSPDQPPVRQSDRVAIYQEALHILQQANLAYRCNCSRSDAPGVYSGRCRLHPPPPGPAAWRFALGASDRIEFVDGIQGPCGFEAASLGDPVIVRRDGVAAYQLAVIADDLAQGITHVVRGADLLESTAWQLEIAAGLGAQPPAYAHVPVVTEPDGSKLAKSLRAPAVADLPPGQALTAALGLLGFDVPSELDHDPVPRILDWAVASWPPRSLKGLRSVALPA